MAVPFLNSNTIVQTDRIIGKEKPIHYYTMTSAGSAMDPHDKMRSRDVNMVARGQQAPRPANKRDPPAAKSNPTDYDHHQPIQEDENKVHEQLSSPGTTPCDVRFPSQNQTRHCYTRYLEYHKCIKEKGEEDQQECEKFAKYYRALCPSEWIEQWNEQRERGVFPGPI